MGVSANPRLLVGDFGFDTGDRRRLEDALAPGALVLVKDNAELPDALRTHPETDVLCTFRPPADVLALAPNLRWLCMPSAGADGAVRAGLLEAERPVLVTTANGVHSVPITEFVFSALLVHVRSWPRMLALQGERAWPDHQGWLRLAGSELHGATLGVVGVGAIGRQIARVGHAFGMRVVGTRRSAAAGASDADLDRLYAPDELRTLLAESDFVVVAVPRTAETQHMLGADEFHGMKRGAFLVNIARGSVIDEAALVAALRDGALAGAALDVFEQEPLPADSPLWTLPNVLISPHVSGATSRYSRRFTDLLLENLARYRAGEPLRNLVDRVRGY